MTVKVLALTRYDDAGASSRVRFYQFRPVLERLGFEVEFQPLLDRAYVQQMLAKRPRSTLKLAAYYSSRLTRLLRYGAVDVVWLEKEIFPWAPSFLDPGLLKGRTYIVDYDDAIFHNYDQHRNGMVRRLFGDKIPAVMRGAAVVVAGNSYISEFASFAGARRIEVLPSVVDGERFQPASRTAADGVTVGWIGSPATQHFLAPLLPILAAELDPRVDRFVTIGANFDKPVFPGHLPLAWNLKDEPRLLSLLDIGLMPLRDAPFERGKCGFKIVQYMACGIPVIVSPVGVNASMVVQGLNGFLASSPQEWVRALRALRGSQDLRRAMGGRARQEFDSKYSIAVIAPKLASIISSVASAPKG